MSLEIMIDIETLDNTPSAVILSIGACKFDTESGEILDKFYVNVDPRDCKQYGLTIGQSTVDWWKKQDKAIIEGMKVDQKPLKEALADFNSFAKGVSKFWSHGATFDFPIMANAYTKTGTPEPWKFWNCLCSRTVMTIANVNMREHRDPSKHHNALEDCIIQATVLVKTLYID